MMEASEAVAARARLAESLGRRAPTWSVATDILALAVAPAGSELEVELQSLASQSSWSYEMPDDFAAVDPADTQLETFRELFPILDVQDVNPGNPDQLWQLVARGLDVLGADAYGSAAGALKDFRHIEIVEGQMVSTRKALRKRLRFLRDFEDKTARVTDTLRLRHAQMQAKSRLAYEVDPAACDDATLSFCAYLAARANRRSIFMIGEQSRAQDTISAGLEQLLHTSPTTNWSQAALVKPTKKVIEQLAPAERGRLIGRFHSAFADSAQALGALFDHLPERMRAEMVMVKGVDSSRWNAYAGALNTMRSAWVASVLASGLDEILDGYCPGKAPRLMASDLVWWYRDEGKELHEDTRMFSAVPYPWQIVSGEKTLSRNEALAAAKTLGVDAEKTGWVGPRAARELERPAAEPALVHGVVVSDPQLALNLRRCGVFSSKGLKHLDELPILLARETQVDDKGQKTSVVVGALEGSPMISLLGFDLSESEIDAEQGRDQDQDLGL